MLTTQENELLCRVEGDAPMGQPPAWAPTEDARVSIAKAILPCNWAQVLDIPRFEVVDELFAAARHGKAPFHDGAWARGTLAGCLALLDSARDNAEVDLRRYARIHVST